jgi:hypothetical protein
MDATDGRASVEQVEREMLTQVRILWSEGVGLKVWRSASDVGIARAAFNAMLGAYADSVRATERSRVRAELAAKVREMTRNPFKPSGHDSGDWSEYARDCGFDDALLAVLALLERGA